MKEKVLAGSFFCLCLGSLFLTASQFVNAQVTPKWYFMMFMGMILALTVIAFLFFGQAEKLQYKSMLSHFCIIITIACVAQAAYGIFQYFNLLPSGNEFRVTGSFDNPAGFAACLCAGFPFLFYYIQKKYTWQRWIFMSTVVIVCIAVILSASRTGIMSLFVMGLFFLFHRIRIQAKRKMIFVIVFIVIVLSGLYFLKKDSADGRLLIWRCSWEMVADKPLFGHGYDGFKANYMNYQADYFTQYPDSKFAILADNVNRPFNEYILLITNYGLAGLILFLVACWLLWKSFLRCRHENIARLAGCCLLSIAVFAFFSYPLRYPFVWVMVILSIAIVIYKAKYPVKIPDAVIYPAMLLMIPAIIFSGAMIYQRMSNEILWCQVANKSLLGKIEQVLPVYDHLHELLNKDVLFLYNYAAELNVVADYDKSLQIARECEKLWADYDLQMLMADSYEKAKQYDEAEAYYKKAAAMCPVRFMPLYQMTKLHDVNGNKSQAQELAKIILKKKAKIFSPIIQNIKREMQWIINKEKTNKLGQNNISRQPTPKNIQPP